MKAGTFDRRGMLSWLGGSAATVALAACGSAAKAKSYPVQFSDAEWKKRLTAEQYYILRKKGTEPPFTSVLLKEHRTGTFLCAADGNPLFSSSTKYDSRTGWPSFWQPIPNAVAYSTDFETGLPRKEVHCARCGGHLGHVFNDGPKPTGKRFCMNGDALTFKAA
ncbi:peptide-methionine (R)-S-oxide reductase MsrB [Novosphingobium sp.]|uniref:peptide-methionine (R)-S-oxide reductase MsrB n=1 Tax=Novosphingobium sp. TaxID=1874826 RepID=UPI00286A7E6E|nr:peptide-methionine (R)-S-oxide reductase MsrB [Novosphingobium sp.]